MTYPGFEFHRLNGFVPRVSAVYDILARADGAQARARPLLYNAGTMTNANSMMAGFVNPMARTVKRYRWDGTLSRAQPGQSPLDAGRRQSHAGSNLELPYTDEFVVGLDQQFMANTTLRFNYVRKLERNRMKLQNTAIPFEATTFRWRLPTEAVTASTADDRVLTLYSLDRAYVGQRADVLMNDPLFTADYETYNVEVVKRLSGKRRC